MTRANLDQETEEIVATAKALSEETRALVQRWKTQAKCRALDALQRKEHREARAADRLQRLR